MVLLQEGRREARADLHLVQERDDETGEESAQLRERGAADPRPAARGRWRVSVQQEDELSHRPDRWLGCLHFPIEADGVFGFQHVLRDVTNLKISFILLISAAGADQHPSDQQNNNHTCCEDNRWELFTAQLLSSSSFLLSYFTFFLCQTWLKQRRRRRRSRRTVGLTSCLSIQMFGCQLTRCFLPSLSQLCSSSPSSVWR